MRMSEGQSQLTRAQITAQAHTRFVLEYLKDFNGKQAAIRCGYSERSAAQYASRLLTKDNIQKLLTAAIEARNARIATEGDEVLEMVEAVAEADPNALVEMRRGCCRFCHGENGEYQHTKQEWKAIAEQYEADRAVYLKGAGSKPGAEAFPPLDVKGGIGFNPNLEPNKDCSECWGEGEVRTFIKDTRTLTPAERRLFGGIKETQHGVEIKTNSQDKARELLMRHHGLLNDKLGLGNPDGSNFNSAPAAMIVRFVTKEQVAAQQSEKAPANE